MRDYLVYDGVLSSDFNVFISGSYTYVRPERDQEFVSVPGRNGDLVYDNGRYKNVVIQYPAFIREGFPDRHQGLSNALLSRHTYYRLTDTYHPDEYRMAIPKGALKPATGPWNSSGKFTIEFTCKPQRWLISGEQAITLTANGSLLNPTLEEAKPLIRIYGTGTVGVGSMTIEVDSHGYAYVDVDSELQDCFYGAHNLGGYVTLSGNEYPTLGAGTTNITLDGVTSVEITPRWWRL